MVKLMPGYVEDVAAWQARLEDLAAKGWFYVPSWILFRLASFERGSPRPSVTGWNPQAKGEMPGLGAPGHLPGPGLGVRGHHRKDHAPVAVR